MKKNLSLSRLVGVLMALSIILSIFALPMSASAACWPTVNSSRTVEFIASKTIPVYTSSSLTQRGSSSPFKAYDSYVGKNDTCVIATLADSYLYISYPAGNTRKWGFVRRSDVLPNVTTENISAKSGCTTYRYPSGASYGSISTGDVIYKCGETAGYSAVIYPISGGRYKLGFVPTSTYNSNVAHNPIGSLDNASSPSVGKLTITGWALDQDSYNSRVTVHIYIGGPAGSTNAYGVSIGAASAYRPDVDKVYHAGSYHGFSTTISVPSRFNGTNQTVYAYGINVGGGNSNPLIGTKTVSFKGNTPTPTPVPATLQYPMSNAYVCGNNWRTYYSARASRPYHVGLDLASRSNDSNVYATGSGRVAAVGWNNANGNYVVIQHTISGKTVYSFYAHLASYCVATGNSIAKGQKIGVFGNTGSGSQGRHLHFAFVSALWSGSYYGYVPYFTGDKTTYSGVTYYNPAYVIANNRLP